MFGLEAISHYNGWIMAVSGALIVMAGLGMLSLVISQLYRIIALFEKRPEEPLAPQEPLEGEPSKPPKSFNFPLDDLKETASLCIPQTAPLGDLFELKALLGVLRENGWPAPHLMIRSFREMGLLVPAGDGFFSWKQ